MSDYTATNYLARLIDAKKQILVQLLELVQRQAELVQQGKVASLLPVFANKQQLLNKLQQVEQLLNPYRDEEPESRVWESEQIRDNCRKNSELCNQLLQAVFSQEQACETNLKRQKEETEETLKETDSAQVAMGAYQKHAVSNAGMLDLSSE